MMDEKTKEEQKAAMPFLAIDNAQMLKEQAKSFDAKKWVWIPTAATESDGYIIAEVQSASDEMVQVKTEKNVVKEVKKEECDPLNPPKYEKCVDMANLTHLNEASVLYNLKARYQAGLIYTYSGLFCIAVNPYRRLPIYNDGVIKMYRGKRRPEMPPHVFAIVDNAYQDMLIEHDNQSMLITGESGAGKTENTKKVIQYIAKVAGVEKKADDKPIEREVAGIKGDLDEQVVQANPLLEAFGNAKTTRNNNSSRFGKFIRCHFNQTGKLAGADIESYLLEKNRVIHQGAAERNYHIFYQVLYASTDEELAALCLPTREAHAYGFLAQGVSHVDRMDDHEEYNLTVDAIGVLGFTNEEKHSMFKITASILNFSMMKFKQKPRDEQAEVEDPSDGERVAYLLGIPVKEFHMSLIKPKVKVGTEFVNKGQSVVQVLYAVSGLAKALFERMFWWIVFRVNKALDTKERRSYFIGVLDIAGFEIFDYNSFEQICINLTNEKLQQFFNHHMFVLEQEEYKKEGIHWEFIDFGMDLEETINLIEKPMGIFAMLEEECIVPKATDQTYLTKLHKQHEKSNAYTKPSAKQSKAGSGDFILHHYAGSVGYSVAHWLEKNKDPINEHTAQLFSKATDALVSHLFQDYNPDKATKRKGSAFQTVSYRHKEQLKNLLGTLMSTSPHFVRCIIPNENKAPGEVDGQLVLHQLRCNGVLEGIRICRKGFPSRMAFSDFRQRYQILAASAIPAGFIDGKVAAEKLIEALQLDENEFRIGLTKVFFRSGIVGELEELRDERLSRIISQFQAYCKGHLMRIEYKRMNDRRVGLAVLQRNVRKFFLMRNWTWWKLYVKVQPMLSIARAEDEMQEKEEELKKAMENAEANEKKRKELEEQLTEVMTEKDRLFTDLQSETERLIEAEDQLSYLNSEKDKLDSSLAEALEKLEGEEHNGSKLLARSQKAEKEIEDLTAKQHQAHDDISKLQTEKTSREREIDSLNDEIKRQEEAHAKVTKDKKGVEENLEDRTVQLHTAEDKISKLNKEKNKIEATLKETEFNLQKEKEARQKIDKEKRKLETDLKETKDKLATCEIDLQDARDLVSKQGKAIKDLEDNKETNEILIKQLQKKIQDLLEHIDEVEEELENERKLRQKVELARKELEIQLEELGEQLEIQGGATSAQVEVSKKKDAECARLRREIEEINSQNDEAAAAAKIKFNQAIMEAQEDAESIKKSRAKVEKEKNAIASELADINNKFDASKKQKVLSDKANRALDDQVHDLRNRLDASELALQEAEAKIAKTATEGTSTSRLLEESEHKYTLLFKTNKDLQNALSEAKSAIDVETKGRQGANMKLQDAIAEMDSLSDQFDEEQTASMELKIKIGKLTTELNFMKSKFDEEGSSRVEELEETKRKLVARVQEMEQALSAAETKASGMEKVKMRMNEEVEDLLIDLERAQAEASALEKKQRKVDQQMEEWKIKCEDLQVDFDKSQREARNTATENVKVRSAFEDAMEKYESVKKENRALLAEIQSVSEQLSEGGRNSVEVEKVRRKLGLENEELQMALEETEHALEQEESRFLKLQLEYAQLKQSTDRKINEKDDEIETSRKNHSRQIESLQHVVDAELNAKTELQRGRKLLETHIYELEAQLDSANRCAHENGKTNKKLQSQMKDLQSMIDDEGRGRDETRDSISRAERRANELAVQLDETRVAFEQSERARKQAEAERGDHLDRIAELQTLYNNAANQKRKAEQDYHELQEEIEELENEAKSGEEKAVKAMAEVTRVLGELNAANESATNADRARAALANQVAQLSSQTETGESAKGLKMQIRKLEGRILELESELDDEGRRSADVMKQARKADKRLKEMEFQLEDERRAAEKNGDVADKLNDKMKRLRLQIDDLEAQNSLLHGKYKTLVVEFEECEERGEAAEQALQKARQRNRTQSSTRIGSRAPSGSRTPHSRTARPEED